MKQNTSKKMVSNFISIVDFFCNGYWYLWWNEAGGKGGK